MGHTRFTEQHYRQLHELISRRYGIQYGPEKKDILKGRAQRVMQKHDLEDWDEFINTLVLGWDEDLVQEFVNAITVNKTDFFRESQHFDYILHHKDAILANNPAIRESGEVRAWSAASSTGEEPYTLAMVLKESFGDRFRIKVLATDIDTRVLMAAQRGVYSLQALSDVPKAFLLKYFSRSEEGCGVSGEIKNLVTFRSFNLMNEFPFSKKFDIVFCRNVMIYFDKETQANLVAKIHAVLNPGGLLFTGHSEALPNKSLRFRYMMPAVYMKY